ncbi:hypothetical protein Emag_003141 [Eimeria magna]
MEPADLDKAPASAVYDSVPLKADEITRQENGNAKQIYPSPIADLAPGSAASSQGYKENLEELQKILKLLESERSQMSQRQEHLVDQHAKIDFSLQVILDEIAALKEQTALENDLNVLMVQFIVVAVRLLVEAAFNKDKVEELLPSLEAELQRLNLPARHPRLLSCFNRLREVCGKPPVSAKDLSPVAVVISAAPSTEGMRDEARRGSDAGTPRLNAARSGSASSSGESLPVKRVASGEGQTDKRSEDNSPRADGRTSLVDESDDEKKRWPGSSSGEKSLSAAASTEEAQLRLPKTSASAEFSPRRESVFTPKERRRTATAFGDGDLPLFQQFAVAAAAPAPDAFSGLRMPMDTATLSKSCRAGGGIVCDGLHAEVSGRESQAASAGAVSSSSNRRGARGSAEDLGSAERDEEGMERALSHEGQAAQGSSSAESSLSVDGLLKHATTILSMSPSELRAALLQSASGAKFSSGIKQLDARDEGSINGRKEGMSSGDRLDSEGPLAPMSSLAEPTNNKDQLQLLQEAVVAMARAVSGDFKANNKQQRGSSSGSASQSVPAGSAEVTQQQQQQQETSANEEAAAAAAAAGGNGGKETSEGSSSFQGKESNNPSSQQVYGVNQQTGASPLSPAVSSPFAGRIAPPSTPDGLTYACGQLGIGVGVQGQAAAPSHISAVYEHPDQKHWQQFYNDAAAAAQQQRKEQALLESHYINSPGQWSGGAPYGVYGAPLEKGMGAPFASEALLDSDRFFGGNGLVYGNLKGNMNINNSSIGSSRAGVVPNAYAAPVARILPPLKIANPRARSAAQEQQRSCCPPRVLAPCMLGWSGRQRAAGEITNNPNNSIITSPATVVSQDNAFETPRVEGGWACCRGLTCESKGGPKISSDS